MNEVLPKDPESRQEVAGSSDSQVIFPLHLLVALAEEREGIVRPVLEKCGVQPDAIVAEGRNLLSGIPKVSAPPQAGLYASQPLNEVLERAFQEATRFKDEFVSTEHLLLAISSQKGDPAAQLLQRAGATHDTILKALVSIRGNQRVTDQNPETKYQALERYAVDLTQSARDDKLDPVIGREDEIRRVMQVLSRRTKNNPVLIGEPGAATEQAHAARISCLREGRGGGGAPASARLTAAGAQSPSRCQTRYKCPTCCSRSPSTGPSTTGRRCRRRTSGWSRRNSH